MNHSPEEARWSVFQDEDSFEKIYSDCMERQPRPTKESLHSFTQALDGLQHEFEKYITLLQKDSFKFGYECGWNAAIKKILTSEQHKKLFHP